jgi:hypothetical protein
MNLKRLKIAQSILEQRVINTALETKPQCPFLAAIPEDTRAELETRLDPNSLESADLQALALKHGYTGALEHHTKP